MNSDDSHGVHSSTEKTERFSSTVADADNGLIAASRYIFVSLHDSVLTDFDGYVSVDDVVFHGRFKTEQDGITCRELMDTVQSDKPPLVFDSNKPNSFRFLYVFEIAESSVRVGIGWNQSGGKIDMLRFKVQYNPNKVADSVMLDMLIKKISRFAKSVELKRFDMAVDIPIDRYDCRMLRDKRNYEYYRSRSSLTEYLGTRSHAGYVKLYDKTTELKEVQGIFLDNDWTRLELTCDGDWSVDKIAKNLPTVVTWYDIGGEDTTPTIRALAKSISLLIQHDEPIDGILAELEPRARRRIEDYLEADALKVKPEYIQHAIDSAHAETARFNLYRDFRPIPCLH